MIFKCGHEAPAGVGKLCLACHKAGVVLPEEKPIVDTQIRRRRMTRSEQARKMRGCVQSDVFVVRVGNEWRRDGTSKPGPFVLAKVYRSKRYALQTERVGGIVMQLIETEQKTIANYEAQKLKGMI